MKFNKLILTLIILIALCPTLNAKDSQYFCECSEYRKLYLTSPPLTGQDVWELQRELKNLGFYKKKLSSIYDWETYLAVKNFQQRYSLKTTGEANQNLWLNLAKVSDSIPSCSDKHKKRPIGDIKLLVDATKKRLTVFVDGKEYCKFPVAVGKYNNRSPVGEWTIIEKLDMWGKTEFGDKWMRLNVPWGNYGIHGTDKPGSIGYAASHGCIRMYNKDINILYSWVQIGTKVKVIGPREEIKIKNTLSFGQKGKEVILLQERLRKLGFNPGYIDGHFGRYSQKTLTELKFLYGLKDDTIADQNTLYLLQLK